MKGSRRQANRTAVVENCEELFRFRCPKLWEQLAATNDEAIRYCSVCEKNVFYCDSLVEAERLASQGRCIALQTSVRVPEVVGMMEVWDPESDVEGPRARGRRTKSEE